MTRHARRTSTLAALLALALAGGCKLDLDTAPPRVGPPVGSRPPPAGLVVNLVDAGVEDGRVWVELEATDDDLPLDGVALAELRPAFTLAALDVEPVSGLPAWRSLLPLGPQRIARLPVAGPGTPDGAATVLVDVRQPGAEEAQPEDLGGGRFRHVFETPLPAGSSLADTLRVGVFMAAVSGEPAATSTLDFVPSGGAPASRELVVDAACAACHDVPRAHGGTRMGTRICVTCHTYQHADPDTMDPAALATSTRATDPNPLELGRLLHRLHRGRNLPTLYRASSSVTPAPALPSAVALPLPFLASRNTLELGKRFSVVGEDGRERIFGEARSRADGGGPARTVASGLMLPRDYRDCGVCHAGAPQAPAALTQEISRRTCSGCHPDVWFGTEALDAVHLAHPGGPRTDDGACADCHVRSAAHPDPYAPLDAVHVLPLDRLRASLPQLAIVSVRDLRPGARPTVTFKVWDRNGTVTPLGTPTPATDQGSSPSPVPRAFPPGTTGLSAVSFTVGGPVAGGGPEYATGTWSGISLPFSESVPSAASADASGIFTYTFTNPLPDAASGTWTVTLAARRSTTTVHYDTANDRFNWPYTGESVTEVADQRNVHVDVASGSWDAPADPASIPKLRAGRPLVVDTARCNACHGRLTFHGSRNTVEACLACHSPERTDWRARPKDTAGNVVVAGTYDRIEERSTHFKVMIHRIHTGGRTGPASLALLEPYVVYAGSATNPRPYFFDDGEFPADVANCERCHLPGTWRPEAVPADAGWTVANETATVLHAATFDHVEGEGVPPIRAACMGCHATAYADYHIARYTTDGVETCAGCHGEGGAAATGKVHGVGE